MEFTYYYEAVDCLGREIKDTIEAPNKEKAFEAVTRLGYTVKTLNKVEIEDGDCYLAI